MGFKKIVCFGLVFALSAASPICAADSNASSSHSEDAEFAKEYLSEVIDYIKNNYMGGEVSTQQLVEAAVNGMAHSLDDYSEYYTKEQYDEIIKSISSTVYELGIDFEIGKDGYPYITTLYTGSAAVDAGLRLDDRIISVNGESTLNKGVKDIENMLTKTSLEVLNLQVLHRNKEYSIRATLKPVIHSSVEVGDIGKLVKLNEKYDNSTIGYIKITQISEGTDGELRQAISSLKKAGKTRLILDLRGNTGGYVEQAIGICRQLVPAGRIIFTKDKSGNVTEYDSYLNEKPFEKLVVLTDNMTASASEIVASAIQDSGAGIVVGQKTYGKGVMQSVIDLSDLGYLKMTSSEYFSRTGKKINGIGVIPNIEVGDVLFVSENDDFSSSSLRTALEFLGYNTLTENRVRRSIGSFQRKEGLPITYKTDAATVSAINLKIFSAMSDTDRTLLEAYVNIIGSDSLNDS